jgi:two-component system sensor histidine kinase YesM
LKIVRFMKSWSISTRLLVYFLTLILLPIFTIGIFGTMIYSRFIEDQANAHMVQMIDQVKENTEFYIKDMEDIEQYLSYEHSVIDFLEPNGKSETQTKAASLEVKRMLQSFEDIHTEIAGAIIVSQNGTYISNEMSNISRDPLTEEVWYKESVNPNQSINLFSKPIGRNIKTKLNYSADDIVSITKPVYSNKKCIGVIMIDMKLDTIKKLIDDITLGKDGFLFIIDPNGNIVYAPVNPIVYRAKEEWFEDTNSNRTIQEINGKQFQMIYSTSSYTNWKTVGAFSLNETLKIVTETRFYLFIIIIITSVLAIIAALIFTSSIAKPLKRLRKLMKKAEEGDFSISFKSKYNDEIGQLGNSFNNMIEKIKDLINEVYREQKSKREAELETLQAQIKPHFLYNTLDTIQWLAQSHGADDVVEIVCALTDLFRMSIHKGKEMISVSEELELVRSYLIIQKSRYEDKIEYEINFEEEVLNYSVIKLILQPLVENAIYHGIKARKGPGKITINAKKRKGKLYFSVFDNGVGIPPEKLEQINEILYNNKNSESKIVYGILNVNERIRLTFGDQYGLKYTSTYGEGTMAEIWHPLIE